MSHEKHFIEFLLQLATEESSRSRAAIAILRRGCSGEEHDLIRVFPLVLPHAPSDFYQQQAYLSTACLFGLHPTKKSETPRAVDLGAAMQQVAKSSESIESRFVALLQSHEEELLGRLRDCIGLAKSKDIPLLWEDVLRAILSWHHLDGPSSVRRQWASSYWKTSEEETEKSVTEKGTSV